MKSIDEIISLLEKRIITGNEFGTLIETLIEKSDGRVSGIYYKCTHASFEGAVTFEYGKCGENEATSTKKFDLDNNVSCSVSLWYQGDAIKEEKAVSLFKTFWNCNNADNVSGILCSDKAEVKKKCSETLKYYLGKEKKVAIFMMDMDNFKNVNDMNSHEFGNKVLREATNVMLGIIGKTGILIHQSGDEFNVIFPYDNPVEILKLGKNISFGIKNHFKNSKVDELTMSIGVWLPKSEDTDFEKALNSAEQKYFPKSKNAEKQRDSIRIGRAEEYPTLGNPSMELGISRVKSNIYAEGLFHNIYLDFLSDFVAQIKDYYEIKKKIEEVEHWINPLWNTNFYCSSETEELSTSEMLAPEEVGLALVHGLLKNRSLAERKIKIELDESKIRVLLGDDEIFSKNKKIKKSFFDECVIPKQNLKENLNEQILKKIVLVQAGYQKMNIPTDVFYHVVKVDNRPYIGGGLPDFWAAALCDLIADGKRNPNFKKIIVFGDTENTVKIKRYLENIDKWDKQGNEFSYEYISKKTCKSVNDIMLFQNKYKDYVSFANSEEDLIQLIYHEYQGNVNLCMDFPCAIEEPRRFLNRRLSYDSLQLELRDGCRVKSLSDAYPTVLEILRNSSGLTEYNKIIDQAGRELLELTNFKIILCNARSEDLPDYYKFDKLELDDYYNTIFGEENGLFMKRLQVDNQLKRMLEHVVSVVENPDKQYATRRAILVVPNIGEEESYSPLGLVSVWLAPRFMDKQVVIDVSYTWRTVEALVGLPLSMYASIKFADNLVEMVKDELRKSSVYCPIVKRGEVSYLAYSLHMFLDQESMNIVRGIINEASI